MDWYDAGEHSGSFSVAGYELFDGDWQDVENGDPALESLGADAIQHLEGATVHYISTEGDDIYLHIDGPFDDWDSFIDYIDYALEPYSVA